MGDIVNLNKARKARAKAKAEKTAVENRARFGRTKAQKKQDAEARKKAKSTLDQASMRPDTDQSHGSADPEAT